MGACTCACVIYKQHATSLMQSNATQMTSHEKRKFKFPEYAKVFWNQAPMMQSAADTDLMITYDKDKNGRKAYALYDNPAAFYKDILTSSRNAYELIQAKKPCPLHMDIEWYGQEDVSKEQLRCIIHEFRDYCLQTLSRNIDINVVKSSRLTDRGFKNSFHTVSPTVVFDNNHDGTMREFVDEFRKSINFDFATTGCIDMSIYTPNRNMRLPHCCKFGSDVPFIRISNDALEDDFSGSYDDPTDEDSYAPFILTNPEINGDVIQIHTDPSIQCGKHVKSKKRSRDGNEGGPTTRKVHKSFDRDQRVSDDPSQTGQREWTSDMFTKRDLEDILRRNGDTVSRVTKITKHYERDDQYWVQCDQRKQQRRCIINPDLVHDSNNCCLRVTLAPLHGYAIEYSCTSESCKIPKHQLLGYIPNYSEPSQTNCQADAVLATRLEKLMGDAGDMASKVCQCDWKSDGTCYITCDSSNRVRTCLHDTCRKHDNTNCYLRLVPDVGSFHVMYKCHDEECKHDFNRELGVIARTDMPEHVTPPRTEIFNRPADEGYSDEKCRTLPKKRAVAIHSPCGSGKTKQIKADIENSDADVILIVSHRIALSTKAVETFPAFKGRKCEIYSSLKDEIDIKKHFYLAIQLESLSRLTGFLQPGLKIKLFFDEWCSIGKQMHSRCGNTIKTQATLAALIKLCYQVTILDGYLDQPNLDVFESYLGGQAYLVVNQYQSRTNQTFEYTDNEKLTVQKLFKIIKDGGKVISPVMEKALGERIYTEFCQKFGGTKKAVLYSRDNPCQETDIDKVWAEFDLVLFTSVIDGGLSFETKGHFTHCICFFNDSIGPMFDVGVQMLSRARDTIQYIICTRQRKHPFFQDTNLDTILAEMPIAVESDDFFVTSMLFGIDVAIQKRNRTWADSNAFTKSYALTESIRRRSVNDFQNALLQRLRDDGAVIRPLWFRKMPEIPHIHNKKVDIPGSNIDSHILQLCNIYKVKKQAFDPEDKDAIKRYFRVDKQFAFHNLTILSRNGSDFMNAIASMLRQKNNGAGALYCCGQTGLMDSNALSCAEVQMEVNGFNDTLRANEILSKLFELVLGNPGLSYAIQLTFCLFWG